MSDNDNLVDIEFHYEKIKKQIKANIKDTIIEIINQRIIQSFRLDYNIIKEHNR